MQTHLKIREYQPSCKELIPLLKTYSTIDIARLFHNNAKKAQNENKQEIKNKSESHSLQKTNIEAMEALILYIQCHVIDKKQVLSLSDINIAIIKKKLQNHFDSQFKIDSYITINVQNIATSLFTLLL